MTDRSAHRQKGSIKLDERNRMETSDAYRSIEYPATPSRESHPTCLHEKTLKHFLLRKAQA